MSQDWSVLASTSTDVSIKLVGRAELHANVELFHGTTRVGAATVTEVRDGVAAIEWIAEPSASIGEYAGALRALIRRALDEHGFRRVEMSVPTDDARAIGIAMRTGIRREGIARQSMRRADELVDAAVFAAIMGDPATDTPAGYTHMLDSVLPKKRLISHVVMSDRDGRILLCKTTFKRDWELPGGIVEPGENPVEAARREVLEEIGVDIEVGRLLVLDWLPPYLGWGDAIELLYDGGDYDAAYLDSLVYDRREITGARWCTPDDAAALVSPLNARRLGLLSPVKPAATLHLQDGVPTTPRGAAG